MSAIFSALQFLQSLCALLGVGRLSMPARLILHEGDALALHRVGQDALGFPGDGGGVVGRQDLLDVVAVGHLVEVEAEGRPGS